VAVAVRDWRTALQLPLWVLSGKARFKERLADCTRLNVSLLPVNERVVEYVRAYRAQGRTTVLVTAAHRTVAELVSSQLGCFDQVVASGDGTNLRGHAKAQRLVELFGVGGFTYVGNDASDLAVWARAGSGVLVDAPARIARLAATLGPMSTLQERPLRQRLAALARALRPHQWSKNLLVFMPMLAAGAVLEPAAWAAALLTFVAFCATASGIYLVNDIVDVEADRQHPRKRRRPLASGALPLRTGLLTAPLLMAGGLAAAALAGVVWIVALYAATSVLYSFWFKRRQLADVFVLSMLYTIRLFAGGEATDHRVTMWLLAFSTFLFLALAIVKRVGELVVLDAAGRESQGREYAKEDIPLLTMMGVASTFASTLVFALYIQDQSIAGTAATPWLLWLNLPLLLFWQCRIWLSTTRGYMHDDPIVYAARDWVSRVVAGLFLIVHVAAVLVRV
jgi:4-hydroxybenzoate polyprenyltransferase/phosphoserine phosphatase